MEGCAAGRAAASRDHSILGGAALGKRENGTRGRREGQTSSRLEFIPELGLGTCRSRSVENEKTARREDGTAGRVALVSFSRFPVFPPSAAPALRPGPSLQSRRITAGTAANVPGASCSRSANHGVATDSYWHAADDSGIPVADFGIAADNPGIAADGLRNAADYWRIATDIT
jgi:hypothetical protein